MQEELINVGQKQAALLSLHEIVTSRRNRQWTKVLEEVMFKYVELCVELKKGRLCKDGLMQYRNTCLLVNVQSLEEVVKRFLKLSTFSFCFCSFSIFSFDDAKNDSNWARNSGNDFVFVSLQG